MQVDKVNMKRKRGASLGCLFWIALILLVLVVFLFNRRRIETVLEATGFIGVLTSSQETPEIESDAQPEARETPAAGEAPGEKQQEVEANETVTLKVVPQTSEGETEEAAAEAVEEKRLRRASLYFVFHDGEKGELRRVVRPVYYADSPLTDTLKALLEGPSGAELNQNLISLVPGNSRINSVAVKDGVAYIDMTESFRFNSFGYEGAVLQLKQLIYTATEFPTVSSVQFLIEGRKQQYLNPEGLYIGKPLGRDSL
jgi:spore germination protein GerM